MDEPSTSNESSPSRGLEPALDSDAVEDLMAGCFARPEEEWPAAIDALAGAHPGHAVEIRARFDAVRALGRPTAPPDAGDFPARLGEFELLDRLGGGGMGVVFRARQTTLDRVVALKLVRPEHLYFRGSRERFRREVEAIAQLQHSGIISIHTVGEEAGLPFFAMELLGGPTLSEVLADLSNRAPESLAGLDLWHAVAGDDTATQPPELFRGTYVEACLRVARQVAEALEHAHGRDILHRDVKPSNVALRPDGRAVLFDFGLTSSAGSGSERRVTRTGTLLGTLAYMSPEQVQGRGELDARTDVYSLGVTLYELLTLHLPFGGRNALQVQARILAGSADSMRARNRRVSEDAETVCRKAMALRAQDRYSSAAAFARDLANVLARHPIEARPPGLLEHGVRWCRRNVAAAVALALGALLLVGLPTGLLIQKSAYAGDLRRALASEQAALTASNAALAGERRARKEADRALASEQQALHSANAALHRERDAREETHAALAEERRARAEAARARDEATDRLRETEDVLDFVVHLFEAAAPSQTRGQAWTAQDLLDFGAERIETALRDRPRSRARILQTVGKVYVDLYRYEAALPLLEEAAAAWRAHDDADARANLAAALTGIGDVLTWQGHNDGAEACLKEALRIGREAMDADDPRMGGILRALGDALLIRDRAEEALPYREEALAIVRRDPRATPKHTAIALGALGACHLQLQHPDQAAGPLAESLEIFRRDVGGPDPGFASTLSNLAAVRMAQGRLEEAEELFGDASDMYAALFDAERNHSAWTMRANLGALRLHRGRATGSRELVEEALEMVSEAADGFAAVLSPTHPRTLQMRSTQGIILLELGRDAEALDHHRELLPLLRRSFGAGDIYTASGHLQLAECHLRLDDAAAAAADLFEALRIMDPLENFDPMKVRGHWMMGRAQLALGDEALAREHLRAGLAFEPVVPDAEHLPAIRAELARLGPAAE